MMLPAAGAGAQDQPAAPAGTGCVAVMPATVSGGDGNAVAAGEAVRDLLVSYLSGPSLEAVALTSKLRVHGVQEAQQRQCAWLVTMTLTLKRGGGGAGVGRVLGNAASTAAWYIPGGSAGAAVARGVSAGTASAIGEMAESTRAKDEARLQWTLVTLGGKSIASASSAREEKLKASSHGEDILSPLVQRSAEKLVEIVLK